MKNKLISGLVAVIFAWFAYVQYNDPDPLVWIFIYGSISLIAIFQLVGFIQKPAILLLMIIYAIYAMFYLPGMIEWLVLPDKQDLFGEMSSDKMYLEETREFFGLLIGIGTLFLLYRRT